MLEGVEALMDRYKWQRIDVNTIQHAPQWLTADDFCFYAREYVSGGGYDRSETNQLIYNLKKPVSHRGMKDWPYKGKAIRQFATELAALLTGEYTVTCIPSSKPRDHTDYDKYAGFTTKTQSRNYH